MSWARIDDAAPQHPKVIMAGAEGFALWVAGMCYSNAHTLDGRLAKELLPAVYSPLSHKAAKIAKKLCSVGLWHDRGDYYEIHDYEKYQSYSMKVNVEARREADRERKRPGNKGAGRSKFQTGNQTESNRSPDEFQAQGATGTLGWDGMGSGKTSLEVRDKLAVGAESPESLAALARLKAVR